MSKNLKNINQNIIRSSEYSIDTNNHQDIIKVTNKNEIITIFFQMKYFYT